MSVSPMHLSPTQYDDPISPMDVSPRNLPSPAEVPLPDIQPPSPVPLPDIQPPSPMPLPDNQPPSPVPLPDIQPPPPRPATGPQHWVDMVTNAVEWDDFEEACVQFAHHAVEAAKPRRNEPTAHRSPRRQPRRPRQPTFDVREASRIQKLYRRSKKRAMRHILKDETPSFSGNKERLTSFFKEVYAPANINNEELKQSAQALFPITDETSEAARILALPIGQQEIAARLTRMANSAPGKDRLEYRHIRTADGACRVTHAIFNRCLHEQRIPSAWKEATTILLHKSGPTDDPSNFRPIALQSCLYKLLMAILSDRLTKWACQNNMLSPEQKSARPCEGCFEHTFLLSAAIKDVKRNQKSVSIAWLDLRNAFGSIPHSAVYTILASIGVPEEIILLLKDVYSGATTTFLTSNGETEPVNIQAGVKQGCPMSAILFNLTIDTIIRAVKRSAADNNLGLTVHDQPLSILAYADDLVIMSKTPEGLQSLLSTASEQADALRLTFKPQKCASLSLTCRNGTRVLPKNFVVQGQPIPALREEAHYRYLGTPIGLYRSDEDVIRLTEKMTSDLDVIASSLLAPWQKLDAIKTFVQPCLSFTMRAGETQKKHLNKLSSALIRAVKKICCLPTRASNSFIFADRSAGGLGLQHISTEADIQTITQAMRMLSCADKTVSTIALTQLRSVVHRTIKEAPTDDHMDQYLSGSMDGPLANSGNSGQISTLWSRARSAARRLKVSISGSATGEVLLSDGDGNTSTPRSVCRFLRDLTRKKFSSSLTALPDQGKVASSLRTDTFSNGSSWLQSGKFLRFCDWKFIHRARLNCLPTNAAVRRWKPQADNKCRRCDFHLETLPHIINHCRPNMVPIRRRHDLIQERLAKAVQHGEVFINQHVPGDPTPRERPDITVIEGDKVTIVDIAVPFDNGRDSCATAASAKVDKYSNLRRALAETGKDVEVHGFIVGALGTWHQGNERVLGRLGVSRRYRTLMRKLCCIDAIKGSRDVYIEHMTGHRQYE